jgi:hypothetical protein
MRMKFIAMVAAATVLATTSSFAFDSNSGSEAERQACTPDAFRLCGRFIPDANRVAACLKAPKNKSQLSPACRKVIWGKHKAVK